MRARLDAVATPQPYPAHQPIPRSSVASVPHDGRDGASSQQQSWQATLIADYIRKAAGQTRRMRQRLAQEVLALTGHVIGEQVIAVDIGARRASVVIDGVIFLLRGESLRIVRPCAWCGTGRFESDPITSRSDLGYALAIWQPFHPECEPADLPEDVSW